jgi:hypothetical protein
MDDFAKSVIEDTKKISHTMYGNNTYGHTMYGHTAYANTMYGHNICGRNQEINGKTIFCNTAQNNALNGKNKNQNNVDNVIYDNISHGKIKYNDKKKMVIDFEDRENINRMETIGVSHWVEDNSVANCYGCKKKFSMLLRKHHCRACGRIFCSYCSNNSIKIPYDIMNKIPSKIETTYASYIKAENPNDEVRVCNDCHSHIIELDRIKQIIKVFEKCKFNILELALLSRITNKYKNAVDFCLSKFRNIQFKMCIEELTDNEKKMLWINRRFLCGHNRFIMQYMRSIDLKEIDKIKTLASMLSHEKILTCDQIMCHGKCSGILEMTDVLDIIHCNKNNNVLSTIVINFMKEIETKEMKPYIPFFVANIQKNEYLLKFMISRGLKKFEFMVELYWCLIAYTEDKEQKKYISILLEKVNENDDLFVKRFEKIIGMKSIDKIEMISNESNILNPIFPNTDFKEILLDKIQIMQSNSRPVIVPFSEFNGEIKKVLYKKDDVRKDHLIMNIMEIINGILEKEEEMEIKIVKYNVVPTSKNGGFIEIVDNAKTIYDIMEHSGFTVQNYIMEHNKEIPIKEFRERFIKSTALYCVISHLLGIGDRHLENIMISKSGLLFHIDFSYILGQDPRYSNNKTIRVTPEIVNVIGGYESSDYIYFLDCCTKIYNRLRQHVNIFSNILSLIPSIDDKLPLKTVRNELVDRFEIGINHKEAASHIQNKMGSVGHNFEYMMIDFLHKSRKSNLVRGVTSLVDNFMGMVNYPPIFGDWND